MILLERYRRNHIHRSQIKTQTAKHACTHVIYTHTWLHPVRQRYNIVDHLPDSEKKRLMAGKTSGRWALT
jgi:hypothetical protein